MEPKSAPAYGVHECARGHGGVDSRRQCCLEGQRSSSSRSSSCADTSGFMDDVIGFKVHLDNTGPNG